MTVDPPWLAEHAVDAAQARSLVARHMPGLPDVAPVRVGEGWDNVVWGFGAWAVRFPRRRVGAEILEHELAALPWLAPRLSLPVPCPERVAGPTDDFPARFAAYRLLAGETADRVAPPASRKPALAVQLGRFLADLHALPVDEARAAGLPDVASHGDMDRQHTLARTYIARVLTVPQVAHHGEALLGLLEGVWGAIDPAAPRAACVLHGDLHARHVLLNATGSHIAGIIDWGDVCIGDPACDLRLAWMWLPPAARGPLRAALPGVDRATWARARLHALKATAAVLAWAADVGDEVALREALGSLGRIGCG